jgi:hypothetical protein
MAAPLASSLQRPRAHSSRESLFRSASTGRKRKCVRVCLPWTRRRDLLCALARRPRSSSRRPHSGRERGRRRRRATKPFWTRPAPSLDGGQAGRRRQLCAPAATRTRPLAIAVGGRPHQSGPPAAAFPAHTHAIAPIGSAANPIPSLGLKLAAAPIAQLAPGIAAALEPGRRRRSPFVSAGHFQEHKLISLAGRPGRPLPPAGGGLLPAHRRMIVIEFAPHRSAPPAGRFGQVRSDDKLNRA